MAYDEGLAERIREALDGEASLIEKKMFGGLCFMLHGHMLCGVHKRGSMFRVGPEGFAAALTVPGTRVMHFTGRPMKGFVEAGPEALDDDAPLAVLMALARDFVATLPPKA